MNTEEYRAELLAQAQRHMSHYEMEYECENCGLHILVEYRKGERAKKRVQDVPCSNCGIKDFRIY